MSYKVTLNQLTFNLTKIMNRNKINQVFLTTMKQKILVHKFNQFKHYKILKIHITIQTT